MAIDPKVFNLFKFFLLRGGVLFCLGYAFPQVTGITDPYKIFTLAVLAVVVWRSLLSIYRRMILPAKKPTDYGKWAIVTGSTSGIGKAFAEHLASLKMNLLVISRSEEKLELQKKELTEKFGVKAEFLSFDFTKTGEEEHEFYLSLDDVCTTLSDDGGIGILINNVGTTNEYPMNLEEFSDDMVHNIIQCNIMSTVNMSRTVMKHMKTQKSGCVVNVSSGSGNHPTPMLAIYSATKAFITQFSRSMHIECWDTGVDVLAVTPYYIVSNLYKRKTGTLLAPMPSALVHGTMCQLGKRYIWQGHGYWFHGLLGFIGAYYWGTTARWKKMMSDNRARHDAKLAKVASVETEDKKKEK